MSLELPDLSTSWPINLDSQVGGETPLENERSVLGEWYGHRCLPGDGYQTSHAPQMAQSGIMATPNYLPCLRRDRFAHRVSAAVRAISERFFALSFAARALPPRRAISVTSIV